MELTCLSQLREKKKKKQHTGFMEIKKIKHALLPCIKNIDLVEFGHGFTRKICPNAVIFFRCILFTHKLFVTRLSKYLWGGESACCLPARLYFRELFLNHPYQHQILYVKT